MNFCFDSNTASKQLQYLRLESVWWHVAFGFPLTAPLYTTIIITSSFRSLKLPIIANNALVIPTKIITFSKSDDKKKNIAYTVMIYFSHGSHCHFFKAYFKRERDRERERERARSKVHTNCCVRIRVLSQKWDTNFRLVGPITFACDFYFLLFTWLIISLFYKKKSNVETFLFLFFVGLTRLRRFRRNLRGNRRKKNQ